ncbi:MAG TPA: hypothetical protein VNQ90_05570 [Chthoniobacteraceae bacterium]|nr:hypothetical protein [Chthoniobacteraceae bacterium]
MKPSPTRRLLRTGLCTALALAPVSSHAQYLWNQHTADQEYLWSNDANWLHDATAEAPGNPESEEIQFVRSIAAGQTSYTVVMDQGDQVVTGGVLFSQGTSSAGTLTLDLNEHRLTVGSGRMFFNPGSGGDRTVALFRNGTLQFGQGSQQADLILGGNSAAGNAANVITVASGNSLTFDSTGLNHLLIASPSGYDNNNNLKLDFSTASFVSGGQSDTLTLAGTLSLGRADGASAPITGARHRKGELDLGVLATLSIGEDLVLGESNRTSSNINADSVGILRFSTAPEQGSLTMTVGRDLRIGVGVNTTGSVLDVPDELHLKIGSAEQRARRVLIGYKPAAEANARGNAAGSLTAGSGTLEAYLEEFRVGQNNHAQDQATGSFDFRDATLSVLDISGDAVIGSGANAVGKVWLHGGEASSLHLTVGDTAVGDPADRSLLHLEQTAWSVTSSLTVGSNGDLQIVLGEDGNGGLDLLFDDPASLTIADGGIISIDFGGLPQGSNVWGLRMAGDQVSALKLLLGSRIVGLGAHGEEAALFTDGSHTYYGFAVIPEPRAWSLALSSLALLVMFLRRKPTTL